MNDDLPWVTFSADPPEPGPHTIEFEAHKGELLLKFAVNGRNFAGGEKNICATLNKQQADALLEILTESMRRVGYLPFGH